MGDPQLGLGQLQMAHGSGVQLQVRSQLANLQMRMRFDFSYYLIRFPNVAITWYNFVGSFALFFTWQPNILKYILKLYVSFVESFRKWI